MKISKIKAYKGGWFIGNFKPSVHKADYEVCYKVHPKDEFWAPHYHAKAKEINFLIDGLMEVETWDYNNPDNKSIAIIYPGEVFVIEPYEVVNPKFLRNCSLIVVKTVSDPDDKYEV